MENDFTSWLAENFSPANDKTILGIGDDAALLASPSEPNPPTTSSLLPREQQLTVVSTDLLSDKVDFLVKDISPVAIGYKAASVSLSDIAAMGALPLSMTVAIALEKKNSSPPFNSNRKTDQGSNGTPIQDLNFAKEIYTGIKESLRPFGVDLVGGDTNYHYGPLTICTTAIGTVSSKNVWRRSGAQKGDLLVVTGRLGGSLLGHHLNFRPRVAEATRIAQTTNIHAAIDISDGLAIDTSRLATASHLGAVLDLSKIPVSDSAVLLSRQISTMSVVDPQKGKGAIEHALYDGEDFELLLALSPDSAEDLFTKLANEIPLTTIGYFTDRPGLWEGRLDEQNCSKKELAPLPIDGFLHSL
ncbi:MAG: thiamine-phosphate kinase [Pirellulaceae bacterium]|nr:thiamine-phosphate kinase [Pirellulaceae bacterium]